MGAPTFACSPPLQRALVDVFGGQEAKHGIFDLPELVRKLDSSTKTDSEALALARTTEVQRPKVGRSIARSATALIPAIGRIPTKLRIYIRSQANAMGKYSAHDLSLIHISEPTRPY